MSRRPELPPGAIVVFGGRSDIGGELALRLAPGRVVVLLARPGDLSLQVTALRAAGAADVHTVDFDAADTASHGPLVADLAARFGPIGVAVVAFGILGDGPRAETDVEHALEIVHTDYVAQISVLTPLAQVMRAQAQGAIVVFSSVAGVRVRKANYVYGSTKAGLDGFAMGLADALAGSGASVLVARPGFVVGSMTADLMASGVKPAPFSSTPAQVADAVHAALLRGRSVVWIPGVLRPIFFAMRLLPQRIWRRLPR